MRFFPILLTVFVDSLGFGLVVPLLGPMLIETDSFFSCAVSESLKGWLYSFLVASYCMGQFFGSPILGAISDRLGRKKILILTLFIALFAYILGALSVAFLSMVGLFVSRVIAGVAAGNYAIAQSYVADETEGEGRAKNFGLLGMAWGTGFIIGPFIGGRCVDASQCFLFSWSFPFTVAAMLCLINIILAFLLLRESSFVPKQRSISLKSGFLDVKKAFYHPKLRVLFKVMFIFCFGWGFFTEFCPVFLIHQLKFSVANIADFFAFAGLWVAISQGLLIRPLVKKFSSQTLLAVALASFSFLLFLVSFVTTSLQIFILLPVLAFAESLIFPSAASMISNVTSKENQGEVFGIYNSIQWAAIGLTPFVSGSWILKYPLLPSYVSSVCMFLGFSIFSWFWYKNKESFLSETSL